MAPIIVLEHSPGEDIGLFAKTLSEYNLSWQVIRGYLGDTVPVEIGDTPGLIVLGGTMGVYERDRLPFLNDELKLSESAIAANVPIFGICLGAQLLAAALGANVTKANDSEIGWFDIALTDASNSDPLFAELPSTSCLFEWHGDTFDLPQDAVLLASSALTQNQAFRYGENVYGVQFHPEVTTEKIEEWVDHSPDDIVNAGWNPQIVLDDTPKNIAAQNEIAKTLFRGWVKMLS